MPAVAAAAAELPGTALVLLHPAVLPLQSKEDQAAIWPLLSLHKRCTGLGCSSACCRHMLGTVAPAAQTPCDSLDRCRSCDLPAPYKLPWAPT